MTPGATAADKSPGHRMLSAIRAFVPLLPLVLLPAQMAHAEKADREKPINIEANRVTVDDAKQIATFTGDVVMTQGSLVIRGSKMQVQQDNNGFKSGTAWGDLAYFKQKREGYDEYIEGWAERIEYDGRSDRVQMFVRASMKKGGDEVHGNYISYDGNTEFFQVVNQSPGQNVPASTPSRVRAVIQPKTKASPPPPALPLKPAASLAPPRAPAAGMPPP
jgi:lipopolysaccharide export system protein LptA